MYPSKISSEALLVAKNSLLVAIEKEITGKENNQSPGNDKDYRSFRCDPVTPLIKTFGSFHITYRINPKLFKEVHKVLQALAWVQVPTLYLSVMG